MTEKADFCQSGLKGPFILGLGLISVGHSVAFFSARLLPKMNII